MGFTVGCLLVYRKTTYKLPNILIEKLVALISKRCRAHLPVRFLFRKVLVSIHRHPRRHRWLEYALRSKTKLFCSVSV